MNKVLPLVPVARAAPDPGSVPYSDHMLGELLALHEEMIGQLRLERQGVIGCADFLTGVIEQHEKTAAMLRAKLENRGADITNDGLNVTTARPVPMRQNPWSRSSPNVSAA